MSANGNNNDKHKLIDSLRAKISGSLNKCPGGCEVPLILNAGPKNFGNIGSHNAVCRCIVCLRYWEVTSTGAVVNEKDYAGKPIIFIADDR